MSRYYNSDDYEDWNDIDTGEDELEHYGVPGMKWGVRKQQNSTISPRSALHYTLKGMHKVNQTKNTIRKNNIAYNHKVIKGVVKTAKSATHTINQAKKTARKTDAEYKRYKREALKVGKSVVRKHLTLSGHLKVSGFQSDIKSAGEQWVKLKGRNAASVGGGHDF